MKDNPFEFGMKQKPIGPSYSMWGSYVRVDLRVSDEEFVERASGCIRSLLKQTRETAKKNKLDVFDDSMEIIIKKNPNHQAITVENILNLEPMGTVGIKYLALKQGEDDSDER